MLERIAVIKTGWCETYDGDLVGGSHANIAQFAEGHERYNFRRGPDGTYYGYTPPIGESEAPPAPKQMDDWLVFIVAKRPKKSGIVLVGWYNSATFAGDYIARPEYATNPAGLEKDVHGGQFSYTLTSPSATLIPSLARNFSFRGDHTKRSPVYYLRGNGEKGAWREKLARSLLEAKVGFEAMADSARTAAPAEPRGGICGDQERRAEVEKAAIAKVKDHFGADFHFRDRQKDNCGFDLLFTHKESGKEHHVEVKGTAMLVPHFFMSTNEFGYAVKSPDWQLAMVTDALGEPQLELMDYCKAKKVFDWKTVTWHATARKD